MSMPESAFRSKLHNGSPRRAVCFLALAAVAASAPARPAMAWGGRGQGLIIEEAVRRLPEPLRGLLAAETHLARLREAAATPDDRTEPGPDAELPSEHPSRFFRIDAVTDEPYPFKNFPRRQPEAEAAFGAEALEAVGTAPWSAAEALDRLADALADGRADAVFTAAGDLARSTIGLHMPLHTTKNWDGQRTGNHGISKALEVGLIHRYADSYDKEIRKDRRGVRYLRDPTDRLFDWLIAAHGRIGPILEADAVARKQAKYNPAQHPEDLDDLDAARARPYYETLKRELARRGSPEAAALRDAADHLADLLYTAWVRAGKPLSLRPPADAGRKPVPSPPYWLLVLAVGMLILLLWPRRRPDTGGGKDASGPDSP